MASVLSYDSPFPIYSIDYSRNKHDPSYSQKLAISSFVVRGGTNYLQVLGQPNASHDASNPYLSLLASTTIPYPPTCLAWEPSPISRSSSGSSPREKLATTGDALRILEYVPPEGGSERDAGREGRLKDKAVLVHKKPIQTSASSGSASAVNSPAPMTSLSWNPLSPNLIVTSSIDTTCTVWDIQSGAAVTQLIAHDKEVYDVAWLPTSTDVFVSVGADGSLRAFDLRSLEHSTILYETPASASSSSSTPGSSHSLVRIAFNPSDANYLATFHGDSGDVQVLDMRAPGSPVIELKGHGKLGSQVSSMAWGNRESSQGGGLCTGGDDLVLLWDTTVTPSSAATSAVSSTFNSPAPSQQNSSLNPAAHAMSRQSSANSSAGTSAGGGGGGATPPTNVTQSRYDPQFAMQAPAGATVDGLAWDGRGEWLASAGGVGGGVAGPRRGWVRSVRV